MKAGGLNASDLYYRGADKALTMLTGIKAIKVTPKDADEAGKPKADPIRLTNSFTFADG